MVALLVNILSNSVIERLSYLTAFLKIGGIAVFAMGGLWAAGLSVDSLTPQGSGATPGSFLGATALALLAFKGFTTITNSGGEITDPHRNVGRAIIIALLICLALYLLVSVAVGATRSSRRETTRWPKPHDPRSATPDCGSPSCSPSSPPSPASSPACLPSR